MPIVIKRGQPSTILPLAAQVGNQRQRQQNLENALRAQQMRQEAERLQLAQEQKQRELEARERYNQATLGIRDDANDIRREGIGQRADAAGMIDTRQRDLASQRIDADNMAAGQRQERGIEARSAADQARMAMRRITELEKAGRMADQRVYDGAMRMLEDTDRAIISDLRSKENYYKQMSRDDMPDREGMYRLWTQIEDLREQQRAVQEKKIALHSRMPRSAPAAPPAMGVPAPAQTPQSMGLPAAPPGNAIGGLNTPTAVNPQTGQRIVWDGTQWRPL